MGSNSIHLIISTVGAFLGLFLFVNLLITKKGNRRANIILAILAALYALPQLETMVRWTGLYQSYPHLALFSYPLFALRAPLFFLFIRTIIQPQVTIKWVDLIHASFFGFILYSVSDTLALPGETKIYLIDRLNEQGEHHMSWSALLEVYRNVVFVLCYLVMSVMMIAKKQKEQNNQADQLKGLKLMTYIFIGLPVSVALAHTISFLSETSLAFFHVYCNIAATLLMTTLAVMLVQKPESLSFVLQIIEQRKKRYVPVDLDKISSLMVEHDLIKDTSLKILDLARLAEVTPHALQATLKNEMDLTFADYVNQMRISEFMRRIKAGDQEHFTLLALAYDSGFSSKASFNRIFKKYTGFTPSKYVEMAKGDLIAAPGLLATI